MSSATASKKSSGKKAKFSKTEFPMDKERYLELAPKTITLTCQEHPGVSIVLNLREFSTGSVGYNGNGKLDIEVDGIDVKHQIGFNLTACGSKEAD